MPSPELFDAGLLSPATAGSDGIVSDQAVLDALVDAESAYLRALVSVGIAPPEVLEGGNLEGALFEGGSLEGGRLE